MITEQLQEKINKSYDVLKTAAKMSKVYYKKPLIITYSGGKDSDVILKLAMECLDEEDFEVMNSHTTVDAPETVYYIRDKFKHLNEIGIKATIKMAHYEDGTPKTMWNLIVDKQMPPTRFARYCCKELKETTTPNRFIATGVRSAESVMRRGRNVFGVKTPKKKDAAFYSLERVKENFADSLKRGGNKFQHLIANSLKMQRTTKTLYARQSMSGQTWMFGISSEEETWNITHFMIWDIAE